VRVYQFRHTRALRASEDSAPATGRGAEQCARDPRPLRLARPTRSERFASLEPTDFAPLSSRGLGRRPLMAETRVRIPVAVLLALQVYGAFAFQASAWARIWASRESGDAPGPCRARQRIRTPGVAAPGPDRRSRVQEAGHRPAGSLRIRIRTKVAPGSSSVKAPPSGVPPEAGISLPPVIGGKRAPERKQPSGGTRAVRTTSDTQQEGVGFQEG
jgi:hypothetical protein